MDICYAPYTYSEEYTRVLALDIAKNETGFAILQVPATRNMGAYNPEDELKWIEWGRLKTDKRNDKLMYVVANDLQNFIEKKVQEIRTKFACNAHVVIEHPLFNNTRSEQQYLLFQAALQICEALSVNVTTVTPLFLKSFIKSQVENPDEMVQVFATKDRAKSIAKGRKPRTKLVKKTRFGISLEKSHIAHFYKEVTWPQNPSWPNPDQIANDDEYDAIYLAALGAVFFTDLPDITFPILAHNMRFLKLEDALREDWLLKSIIIDDQTFKRDLQIRKYKNFVWREKGLAHVFKNLKINHHRTLQCKLEFPFNQIAVASLYISKLIQTDPEAFDKLWRGWGSKRTQLDKTEESFLSFNYAGQFFMCSPAAVVSTLAE